MKNSKKVIGFYSVAVVLYAVEVYLLVTSQVGWPFYALLGILFVERTYAHIGTTITLSYATFLMKQMAEIMNGQSELIDRMGNEHGPTRSDELPPMTGGRID